MWSPCIALHAVRRRALAQKAAAGCAPRALRCAVRAPVCCSSCLLSAAHSAERCRAACRAAPCGRRAARQHGTGLQCAERLWQTVSSNRKAPRVRLRTRVRACSLSRGAPASLETAARGLQQRAAPVEQLARPVSPAVLTGHPERAQTSVAEARRHLGMYRHREGLLDHRQDRGLHCCATGCRAGMVGWALSARALGAVQAGQ